MGDTSTLLDGNAVSLYPYGNIIQIFAAMSRLQINFNNAQYEKVHCKVSTEDLMVLPLMYFLWFLSGTKNIAVIRIAFFSAVGFKYSTKDKKHLMSLNT